MSNGCSHRRCAFAIARTGFTLVFILAMVIYLPLFVFLPKLMQRGMRADVQTLAGVFGKNEHVRKICWAFIVVLAGLVTARVVGVLTGTGG